MYCTKTNFNFWSPFLAILCYNDLKIHSTFLSTCCMPDRMLGYYMQIYRQLKTNSKKSWQFLIVLRVLWDLSCSVGFLCIIRFSVVFLLILTFYFLTSVHTTTKLSCVAQSSWWFFLYLWKVHSFILFIKLYKYTAANVYKCTPGQRLEL